MKLDRRLFLQGLVAVAVAAAIPAAVQAPELSLTIDEYAERYIKPAVETLANRFNADMVRFSKRYDIDKDKLILHADYRPDPEHHHIVAVALDDVKDEEIPEIEDMLVHALERHVNGG